MKAMIFAAGRGKRLGDLGLHTPKALLEVGGKPMLQRIAEKLFAAGASQVVVNVHHQAEKIYALIASLDSGTNRFLISDEREQLLDTGGGLKKASTLLQGDEPIVLYNVDILCDIDLNAMLSQHLKTGALATLAVSRRESSRYFLFDACGLNGWETHEPYSQKLSRPVQGEALQKLAFSGIHVISPLIFPLIDEKEAFSIRDLYLRLAAQHQIAGFLHDPEGWADLGSPEKLKAARELFASNAERFES